MIIANYMAYFTDLNEVWLVVSPQNPLKLQRSLARDYDRLHLANLAIGDNLRLKASNIEFKLPKPSYTINTLAYLQEKYPGYKFALIMGGDNLITLPKWKNSNLIMEQYQIYVYKRPGIDSTIHAELSNVKFFDKVPLVNISSSFIRQCIRQGKTVRYMVPDAVFSYLDNSNMYKSS